MLPIFFNNYHSVRFAFAICIIFINPNENHNKCCSKVISLEENILV